MLSFPPEAPDAALVRASLAQKEAFAALIRRYQERLDRYLRRLGVFRVEDREDVLQNVFLKTYRNLNEFDEGLAFSSWIYRIAHNETMSFFRARQVRPDGHTDPDGADLLEQVPGVTHLETELDRSLTAQTLRAALLKLDPKYREALVLRYFEEREYTEISDIMQIPVGSVGTLIARAKKRLLPLLSPSV